MIYDFVHIYTAKTEKHVTPLKMPPEGDGKLLGGGDLCYPSPSLL
jgi:hypothetical protein